MMETIKLGDTDCFVSRLGMGGCPLGGHGWGHVDDGEAMAAVRRAYELGVNFFDTADVYGLGHSEELLARALGNRRKEVIIATKFGIRWDQSGRTWKDSSPGYLKQALHASLRRLRLDCIPLYYIHWPDNMTPLGETVAALTRLREEGKIRWIAISNVSAEQVHEALAAGPVHAVQIQFSLVDRPNAIELLPLVQSERILLVTWGSLAQGLLAGKYDASSTFDRGDRRNRYENFLGVKFRDNLRLVQLLKEMAIRTRRTPAQIALRWLLDTRGVGCVLFGAKRPQQVEENVGAGGWQLARDDYESLNNWNKLNAAADRRALQSASGM